MIAGLVVGMGVNLALLQLNLVFFPLPDGVSMSDTEQMKDAIRDMRSAGWILVFAAHLGQAFVGGWVAARMGASRPMMLAMIVGAASLAAGIANALMLSTPAWTWSEMPFYLVAAWLAGRMEVARRTHVLGHALPELIYALMGSGEWVGLVHSPGFRAICDRYGVGADEKFYSRELMANETKALADPDHAKLFLGKADQRSVPGDIDPAMCVVFAGLGIGSDQSLALDYRCNPPRVLINEFREGEGTTLFESRWICLAEDFEAFYEQLKTTTSRPISK